MGTMTAASRAALVGREAELGQLTRAVGRHRVVSLTGAPGVGKSTLAAAFAASHASVRCALTGVKDADGVCREIARALGLAISATSSASDTTERVGRELASRGRAVLVLDDADLARAALARLVPLWLREAPSARFLVAARGRLGLPTAQRLELGPLEVPAANEEDGEVIARSAAVRLFVRCATAVRPGYRLSAAAAREVGAIVRTLEGLPLAIELCAARIGVLGEREINAMLAERLDALDASAAATGGRTLRGAFALSWDQLEPGAAAALARCAVFRGSFDLDAATAITAEPRLRVAEALERLLDASLLHAFEPPELPGARRYALPASVRVFAMEKLTSKEREKNARRHAAHFADAVEVGKAVRPDLLALSREDLEAALAFATDRSLTLLAARVAVALSPLALSRGPLVPFLARVDDLLARRGLPRAVSAELHLVRGLARIHHGRRDAALLDLAAARRLAARGMDPRVLVLATSKTGLIVGLKGSFDEARAHFDAAAASLAAHPDAWLSGVVSKDLANVLSEEGRNAEATIELARARDLFHAAGDLREEGFVLMMLGSRQLDDGQLEDARRDCTAALGRLRAAGDHRTAAWCEVLLALLDAEEGDLRSARTRLDASLVACRAIGDAHTEGLVLGYRGNVAIEQGAFDDAESTLREARARLAEVGDTGSEAMCTAAAGLVDVALGRPTAAEDRFLRAAALLRGDGRAARRDALAIFASVLTPSGTPDTADASLGVEEVRFARRAVAKVLEGNRARSAGRASAGARAAGERVLVLATDGSWLRSPDGRVVRFGGGGALRAIVRRLAEDRLRYPGRPLALGALVRVGWPGETILPAAAKNRLHVTIARLRRSGLDGLLLHEEDGYLLDPAVPARLAEETERATRPRGEGEPTER